MGLTRESNTSLHCGSNMLPEQIGEYNILDSLGSGTFGDVYKVEKDGKMFALKHVILGSNVDKFVLQLEVDAHESIPKHENIVGFVGYFKSWYRWNIVLEFCELGTLEKYVVAQKLSLEVIKSFMLGMARGLDHLHTNNIVHRDIKPENILLVKGKGDIPICKISDFGVARFIHNQNNGNTNGEVYFQSFRGSPLFVAPEVRKGEYTKSCDIFSMGIVYYLLFARVTSSDKRLIPCVKGGTPFYRATDEQVKNQLNTHIKDEKLNQLVGSMMVIDFHGRISASALVDELQGIIQEDLQAAANSKSSDILDSVEKQLAQIKDDGFCAMILWYKPQGSGNDDSAQGFREVGSAISEADRQNLLASYCRLIDNPDSENPQVPTSTSDTSVTSAASAPSSPSASSTASKTSSSPASATPPKTSPLVPSTSSTSSTSSYPTVTASASESTSVSTTHHQQTSSSVLSTSSTSVSSTASSSPSALSTSGSVTVPPTSNSVIPSVTSALLPGVQYDSDTTSSLDSLPPPLALVTTSPVTFSPGLVTSSSALVSSSSLASAKVKSTYSSYASATPLLLDSAATSSLKSTATPTSPLASEAVSAETETKVSPSSSSRLVTSAAYVTASTPASTITKTSAVASDLPIPSVPSASTVSFKPSTSASDRQLPSVLSVTSLAASPPLTPTSLTLLPSDSALTTSSTSVSTVSSSLALTTSSVNLPRSSAIPILDIVSKSVTTSWTLVTSSPSTSTSTSLTTSLTQSGLITTNPSSVSVREPSITSTTTPASTKTSLTSSSILSTSLTPSTAITSLTSVPASVTPSTPDSTMTSSLTSASTTATQHSAYHSMNDERETKDLSAVPSVTTTAATTASSSTALSSSSKPHTPSDKKQHKVSVLEKLFGRWK